MAVVVDRLLNLPVDLLLSAIGGSDTSVQPRKVEEKTDQTNTASANLHRDQMEGQNEPMEKGQSRSAVKKRGYMGTDIKRVMPRLPSLQGASGHLMLGDTLSLHVEILRAQIGPLEAVPALMAVEFVAVRKIEYSGVGLGQANPPTSSAERSRALVALKDEIVLRVNRKLDLLEDGCPIST